MFFEALWQARFYLHSIRFGCHTLIGRTLNCMVYVNSFSVFHIEAAVSIGLKNVLKMVPNYTEAFMSPPCTFNSIPHQQNPVFY